MKHFFFLFAFFLVNQVTSQSSFDSLPSLFEEAKQANTQDRNYEFYKKVINFTAESDAVQLLEALQNFEKNLKPNQKSLWNFLVAESLYYSDQAEESLVYYDFAIQLEEQAQEPNYVALITILAGRAYVTEVIEGPLKALPYYTTALSYSQEINALQDMADVNYSLATVYSDLGDYQSAVEHARNAFEVDLHLGNDEMIVTDLRLLSEFNLQLNNAPVANYFLNQSLPYLSRVNNSRVHASIYQKKAKTLVKLEQSDSALFFINQAIDLEQTYPNSDRLTECFRIQAEVFLSQGETEKALTSVNQAIEIAESKKQEQKLLNCKTTKMKILFQNKDFVAMKLLGHDLLNLSKEKSYLEGQIIVNGIFSSYYQSQGDFERAFAFQQREHEIAQLLQQEINNAQIQTATVKFDMEKVKHEKRQLQYSITLLDQKVAASNRTKLLLGIILFLLTTIMGTYWYNRNRKAHLKQEIHQQQLMLKDQYIVDAELQAIRSQLNPHFMFNSLNSINDFILKSDPETASDYLVKFSKLMRKILLHSKESVIPFEEEIESLQLYLELESLRFGNHLDYQIQVDEKLKNNPNHMITPMLVQPFVENAIWHGLRPSKSEKKLLISFKQMNEQIICKVVDNGIGREQSAALNKNRNHQSKGSSMLKNRFALIEKLYGKKTYFTIEDALPKGTIVHLFMPILT